ncbi:hypothetical protein E4T66_11610 [Sinimarinibacterium sp. CAU 1509]|uniref:hypothetical protein n=1 Tax=Sinimarinibacterium sp. CAU 1509 TaxID=2562283 RepID=UPI0010AD0CF6|nr:hypothetical protein [Sinimarinibacterium sp. CAU 1509]TJY59825.1 hypothetical protein E4T66_11610 [Sinimarinibacterium sp. CAU 1509]
MRKMAHRGISVAGWIVAAGLTACSGGGSGDGLSLTSKSDVLRELGVLDGATDFVASTTDVQHAKRGVARPVAIAQFKRVSAKDAQACADGGSIDESSGTRARRFQYIDTLQRDVNYERRLANACRQSDTSSGVTTSTYGDGLVETGETADGSVSYAEAGQGGPKYEVVIEQAQGGVVISRTKFSLKGAVETHTTGAVEESFSAIGSESENLENGVTSSGMFAFGSSSEAFRTVQNFATRELSLDGTYRYRTTACNGGAVEITTLMPMTGNYDDAGYYMTGGSLRLDAGSGGASVTFNNDGSASYQLGDGSVGTLTRAEIDQQLLHPCD